MDADKFEYHMTQTNDRLKRIEDQMADRFQRVDDKLEPLMSFRMALIGASVAVSTLISTGITIFFRYHN